MNIENYTQDELDALQEQTDTIAANLEAIEKSELYQGQNLDELEEQTSKIAANSAYIERNEIYQGTNIEELEERLSNICGYFESIEKLCQGQASQALDKLEEQTAEIATNLGLIEQHQR
jgi:hypothetical protein